MKAYIYSVAPYVALKKIMPYGPNYHIAARADGQRYATTEIIDSSCFKDFGEGQREFYPIPGEDIAKDLLRDVPDQGVWAGTAEVPSEAEIAAAEQKQFDFYKYQVAEADKNWARFKDPRRIESVAFIAARELNIVRDWARDISQLVQCKGCKTLVAHDAAKCASCGSILDWDAAIALGLVSEEQVRFATKKGWVTEAKPEKAAK